MAESLKEKPELYYAYSLLGNKNISKNEREINFSNLNKGFYDDIISKDSEIKTNKDRLEKVKSLGIKESIYSNKPIPNTWKNKLGYYSDLYKTMSEDKSFINYLGRTSQDSVSKYKEDKKSLLSKSEFASESQPMKAPNTTVNLIASKYKITPTALVTPQEKMSTSVIKPKKTISNYIMGAIEENQKINSILDEYKTAYPIQLKSEAKSYFPKLMPTQLQTQSQIHNQTDTLSSVIYFPSQICKKDVFKSTIYSNLIPDQANPLKQSIVIPKTKLKEIKKPSHGPFLNFDYASYYKSVEISNPKIKKKLTEIDYYGPYYSHCPSCRNKNLEFYETMEPGQCMKLLTQLKKGRCNMGAISPY